MWDYLEPVAALLPDFSAHRFDQRGCGRSTATGDYSVRRALADIEDLRRHWGYECWSIFGHSWGATLALAYAWTHPDRVERLVYCSGVGPGAEWKAEYREAERARLTPGQLQRRQELEDAARGPEEEIEYLTLCWCTDYADPAAGLMWARRDATDAPAKVNFMANRQLSAEVSNWSAEDVAARCRDIAGPVLVLHGAADPRPLWSVRRIAEMITGAECTVIPAAGHEMWRENEADFAASLREFLSRSHVQVSPPIAAR